jgi:hypothetical protein
VALTSPALVAVLAVIAAALLALVLWSWPRLAARGPRPVALRIVALCTLQLSVLSLVFVTVNRSAGFYASWSDLFGKYAGGGAITSAHYGSDHASSSGSGRATAPVVITGKLAVAAAGRRGAGGWLHAVRIHGQLSGLTAPGFVYLPARYSGAPGRAWRLPVVVVISDQIGRRAATYSAQRLSATAASQITAGRLAPLILVMLPATIAHGDQGCLNEPGGPQAATFFSQDLPDALRPAYRVGAQPSRWGLLGDASGGYCALQLAMTSSAAFSAAVVPPGSYTSPPGPSGAGGSPQLRAEDNLSWLLRHQAMQPISVLFAGPARKLPFLSLARAPMHVASAGLAAGQWPLSPLLDWIGHTLGRPARAGS